MTGNCGFTIKIVAASFYNAILTYLNNGKNYSSLKKISLILLDKQVTEEFIKHFIAFSESMIDKNQAFSYRNQVCSTSAIDVESNAGDNVCSQKHKTEILSKENPYNSYTKCSGCCKTGDKLEQKLSCMKHSCCLKCYQNKASCLTCLTLEKVPTSSIRDEPTTFSSPTSATLKLTNNASSANISLHTTTGEANRCTICLDKIRNSRQLNCGHIFCKKCIEEYMKNYQAKCPICGKLHGKLRGNQPKGDMKKTVLKKKLSGYSNCDTIQITYDFPDGIQTVGIL